MERKNETKDRELIVSRVVNAPRNLVWEAMTNPHHVVHWWGPEGFSDSLEEMDVRPGGVWKHIMLGPDGINYPNKAVFTEVVKPEYLTFKQTGGEQNGRRKGVNFLSTWTFEALDAGRTKVTIHMIFSTAGERNRVLAEYHAEEGGHQTLARLDAYASKMSPAKVA